MHISTGKPAFVLALATALTLAGTAEATRLGETRTRQYRELQARICRGWNTWYNNSMTAHTFLPDGFTVNFGVSLHNGKEYHREFLKNGRSRKGVIPGLRSDDGRYTSVEIVQNQFALTLETAADGEDLVALVTPSNKCGHLVIADVFYPWERDGTVGRAGDQLFGMRGGRRFTVSTTAAPAKIPYMPSGSPRLAVRLQGKIGFYTGRTRTLEEIEKLIGERRAEQEKRVASWGEHADSFQGMQTILAWNTIYDAPNKRAIAPVSRNWNYNWEGWVLFDWDTYFAAWMLSSFNRDLAFANAVEITKSVTGEGFVPNYKSASGISADRSQPPVGSRTILEIYRRYPEKWLLEETYDELIAWNRWWPRGRSLGDGYLAWGGHDWNRDGTRRARDLQSAKYESGLDNSPMFDEAKMLPETCTMDQADVGLMAMYVMDCKCLAEIAGILDRRGDREELLGRAKSYADKLQTMWDEKTGIYRNVRMPGNSFLDVLSPCNFYPLLSGTATNEQADRMINEHYFNPEEFYGEFVMPASARNARGFKDNNYWRGRIWAPLNFLVYLGMKDYRTPTVDKARADLVERSRNLLMKNWKENGGIYENYNSVTGAGGDAGASDAFYHWGALLTFIGILDSGK